MTYLRSFFATLLTANCLLFLAGCSGPSTWIEPPEISADDSAQQAMELYDVDGNGSLDSVELEKAPGLKAAINTLDLDGDEQVSKSEITARIASWQASKAGLTTIKCTVLMDGQPLQGATVTFDPESFLGDDLQLAVGISTRHGVISPSIPKENRPTTETPSGLQLGFYRVCVSKVVNGKETIPPKYNSETILGQQVAGDDPAIVGDYVRFNLKRR